MKPIHLIHTAFAALALASTSMAQVKQPTDAETIAKAQSDAYVAAFNKGEATVLVAMYTEDVQYTNEEGRTVSGRPAVHAGLTQFFSRNKGAKLALQIESARFLTSDVLIEKGLSTIGDDTTRYVCNYVKKDGVWLISELSETTLPPVDAAAEALDDLGWLIGSWKDNTPGVTVATTVNWTKNHHFLTRSVTMTRKDENTYEATEVIGYDPVAGGIRSWVFDSEGGIGEGLWKRDQNKWLVSFTATALDGSTTSAQHVITYLREKKHTWESINRQRDGEVLPNLDKVEVIRVAE
jgi:uncharacterized protein (TIGR02246 family)